MPSRPLNPALFSALIVLLASCWSVSACAQNNEDASEKLQAAGDEAKFRVISRFPDRELAAESLLGGDERRFVDESIRDAIARERFEVARLLVGEKADGDDPYVGLLEAYLTYRAGEADEALEAFDALDGKVPHLEDYRLFWAAESAAAGDEHHTAAIRAAEVPSDSRLFGRSLMVMADALLDVGTDDDVDRAIKTLKTYLTKYPRGRSAKEARVLLAEAFEETEAFEEAAELYLTIREKHAVTPAATAAAQRLQAIKEHLSDELKQKIERPSITARMNRYRALFASHRSEAVIDELGEGVDDLGDDKARRCEALYLVARSHTKLRRHADGSSWYERVLDECDDTNWGLKALYMGGKGYWNSGKQDDARAWFSRIWSDFSDHSYADDAMYFAARIHREEDEHDKAKELLQEQVDTYPSGDMAKDAHWLRVRDLIADEEHEAVVAYVDGLSETGEDDLYSRGRLHYFRARALQQRGELEAAKEGYRAVARENPLSYYAYLAFGRLGQMAEGEGEDADQGAADLCALGGGELCDFVEPARSEEIVLSDELRDEAHFKRGVELLRLGLTKLAEDEFQQLRRTHASEDNLWALTYLLHAAKAHRVSHDLPRRHIQGWKTHYPSEGDDPKWALAFPRPFQDAVDKYVEERELPRALVYAIMREESGFNPRIESWANARGLLQLMEKTAQRIARKDGMTNVSAQKLFEPATNIRLGTGYIEELADQLESHPALVIAGYNGGHGNVSGWLKARGDLPLDLWVEDIPYGQTRKYTKRVLASFWTYAWMYGDERVPRLRFELPEE